MPYLPWDAWALTRRLHLAVMIPGDLWRRSTRAHMRLRACPLQSSTDTWTRSRGHSQWKKKDGSLMCLETPDMFTFVCATFLQYLSYHSLFSLPRCQIQRAVQWRLASKADATALQTLITCSSAGLVQRDEDKKSLDRRYSWRLDVSLIPQFQPKWAECRFKVDSTC